jgi:hypothetical protein
MEDVQIPYPSAATAAAIAHKISEAERSRRVAEEAFAAAQSMTEEELLLTSETADTVLDAFRPPK